MKTILVILIILGINYGCSLSSQEIKQKNLISRLEDAENSQNLSEIKLIFDENAIIYTTELMPIKGHKAIASCYDFVFLRNDLENVKYRVDTIKEIENYYYEFGNITTRKVKQEDTIQTFEAKFEKHENDYKIVTISFGDEKLLKKELPKMLQPTGEYNIGRQGFFFEKDKTDNGRIISFDVWYPTNYESKDKQPFRTENVISAASSFMGIPTFMISYFSEIESNTILEAPPIRYNTFPVLIYNHGYGGFTEVYQTVFEDLVSNGYIVVSIGHENESALLIKENGDVIRTSPDNDFFTKRAPELEGQEIGKWQSIILYSDSIDENDNAYKKMLKLTPLHNESTKLWASDTKAVLEKLELINNDGKKNLNGIFDLDKIGIFGHSLGGATAGQMCFGDTKIKAGINLDGFQFGDLNNNKLKVPFMFVSSNEENGRYLRALTYLNKANDDCYEVVCKGFSHDSFTDLNYILGGDSIAFEIQRTVVKSFFDKYLKNSNIDMSEIESKYPIVKIRKKKKDSKM